ncbi:hypothetical protein AND_010343 [Anopheles darlingi]|uniref:Uncharacterized protein n=1 Tax=Anopheles darlingi TaxID=43151 RepID=W5J5N3_ANODA|nr:hypothetical protein AND_010343 [Anopheles darlingi]
MQQHASSSSAPSSINASRRVSVAVRKSIDRSTFANQRTDGSVPDRLAFSHADKPTDATVAYASGCHFFCCSRSPGPCALSGALFQPRV